jgi:hypothetical protein
MGGSRAWALIIAASVGVSASSLAQIPGLYQLPKNDFVWNWGRGAAEGAGGGFEDFTVNGNEAGFRCELRGRLRPSSRYTPNDMRALESELRGRLDFIYASSNAMNQLDQQLLLEWARLSCELPKDAESTPEEKADREAKAKEKMQREIDRRREREQHQQE